MKKFFSAIASVLICASLILVVGGVLCQNGTINRFLSDNSFPTLDNVASALLKSNNSNSIKQLKRDDALTAKKIDIDANADDETRAAVTQKISSSGRYAFLSQKSGFYYMKTAQMQKLYQSLTKSSYSVAQNKNSKGYYSVAKVVMKNVKLDESDIRIAITAYKNDNPQIFWIANVYSYMYQGNDTVVQLYSYISAGECSQSVAKLNAKVSRIVSALPADLSEFDRELYLYDTVAKNCSYDDAAAANSDLWQSYTAYGALADGKAVCEGYSRAMQYLLSYANMECRLITGEGQNALHMWNLVNVNNAWYHLDATWSDDDQMMSHNYFNLNDSVIGIDHKISPQASALTKDQINGKNGSQHVAYNLSLPKCTSTQENFFRVKGIEIKGFNSSADKSVISALTSAAQRHEQYVAFYIDNNLDYNDTVDKLFQKTPYKYVYYVKETNKAVANNNRIQYNKTVFVESKNSRGVTLKLSYQ